MSFESLLKAARTYLDREWLLAQSADVLERPELRDQLEAAAQQLQSEVHCAGHLARREGAIRNVMVAVDSAEPSEWAVERAVRLVEDLGGKITLIHVLDMTPIAFPELAPYEAESQESQEKAAWELLHRTAALVPHELLAEKILREGNPSRQIVLAAEQFKPDMLVVGTHGRGAVGRFLVGSVAEAVLRHAPCPLLIVAHPFQPAPITAPAERHEEAVAVATS
jgi:nucleotide-binding universal stress UspA family protein